MKISRTNQEALSSTGINFNHVPSGGKYSAHISLLMDLMFWVSQNPPPAHLFVISGEQDFAGILHRLRMNNYNILLASPDSAPSLLCNAATIMWQWSFLLKGENLSGKPFNQPPDGPYGSWYGHFRGTLENPFPVKEQPCLPVEVESNCKHRPIPKAVMKHIQIILQSNPEGILVIQLREELKNSDLTIDKDFYGYNKFTRFLSAMPQVLKLHEVKDGQFLVTSVNSKFLDKAISSAKVPLTNNVDLELQSPTRKSFGHDVPEKLIAITIPEEKTKSQVLNRQWSQNKVKQNESFPPLKNPELNAKEQGKHLEEAQNEEKLDKLSQRGKIEEIRVNHSTDLQDKRQSEAALTNTRAIGDQDKTANLPDEKNKVEETSHVEVKEIPEANDTIVDSNNEHIGHAKTGFLRRISNWWFGPDSSKKLVGGGDTEEIYMSSEYVISPFSQDLELNMSEQTTSNADCESEVEKTAEKVDDQIKDNSKHLGSDHIFQSTTREHLADPVNNAASRQKRLSNMFSIKTSNSSNTGVSQHSKYQENGAFSKPKGEVLNDCQKSVDYITKNFPKGLSVAFFRKLFLKQHGYPLDLQKLGYEKLENLLQIFPGIKVEYVVILPGGPSQKQAIQPIVSDCNFAKPAKNEPDYEPVDEDDFSGSDEEEPCAEEKSSLVQILDPYYVSKEKDNTKVGIGKADGLEVSSYISGSRKLKPGKSSSFDGILESLKKTRKSSGSPSY